MGVECRDGGIVHEIGHDLGFIHEHQRPDHDEYIDVIETNFGLDSLSLERNFNKYSNENVNKLDEPYDLDSIMHYVLTAGSKYGFLEYERRCHAGW